MNTRKICGVILNVFTLIVSLSLFLPDQLHPLVVGTSAQVRSADGGGPVPPRPPVQVADGGGPVPPRPPVQVADGGGPVPPRPPVQVADGGGPVPPRPAQFLNAESLAA